MGSLMAGWDSPVMDDNQVRARRNKSLTKEEIEAFWKLQRKSEGEEEEDQQGSPKLDSPTKSPRLSRLLRVHSAPPSSKIHGEEDLSSTKPDKTGDWWTRSNWAFLNEPPLSTSN